MYTCYGLFRLADITLPKYAANTKQEAQLMLTNPRDAFISQSRSPNTVHVR